MTETKLTSVIRLILKNVFHFKIEEKDLKGLSKKEIEEIETESESDDFAIRFGIAGKTNTGKTWTVNSLFGLKEKRNEVTLKVTEFKRPLSARGTVIFYDFPGAQNSVEFEKEVIENYEKYFINCDVILWVIPAWDRMLYFDEKYILNLPKSIKEKFVIGLSQADRVPPENWRGKYPSVKQYEFIQDKKKELSQKLSIDIDKIVEYCANYQEFYEEESKKTKKIDHRFNLTSLVVALIDACEPHKKYLLQKSFFSEAFANHLPKKTKKK